MANYGTNLRNIKAYAGGRGIVSKMASGSAEARNTNVTSSKVIAGMNSNNMAGINSNATLDSNIAAIKAELNTYSKIATDSAEEMKNVGSKLLATGEESLFGNAETSGKTTVIVERAVTMINDFNKIVSSLRKLGGSENSEYLKKLMGYANDSSELLSKIGVTVLTDGSLTMNSNILKEASLEDLKAVFNSKDSFGDKITNLTEDIKENVEKKLEENLLILTQKSLNSNFDVLTNLGTSSNSYFDMSI